MSYDTFQQYGHTSCCIGGLPAPLPFGMVNRGPSVKEKKESESSNIDIIYLYWVIDWWFVVSFQIKKQQLSSDSFWVKTNEEEFESLELFQELEKSFGTGRALNLELDSGPQLKLPID